MLNVATKIEGNKLVITLNLDDAPLSPSASGKTLMVGSTQGNVKVPGYAKMPGLTVGVNAYVPR